MEKYDSMASFFSAVAEDKNLEKELLCCKTADKMYDFVSQRCSNKFSKKELEDFVKKIMDKNLNKKEIPDNGLEKVSGGNFFKNLFTLKENVRPEDKEPMSLHRAGSIISSCGMYFASDSIDLASGLQTLFQKLRKYNKDKSVIELKDRLSELEDEIKERSANKDNS